MAFDLENIHVPLSYSEKAVLAYLADPDASRNQRHMAQALGLHHQSVNRSLARLERRGLVSMQQVAYRDLQLTDAGKESLGD